MAQDITIGCDLPGCQRHVAKTYDHFQINLSYIMAQDDVPQTYKDANQAFQQVCQMQLDFCSPEHFAEFLTQTTDWAALKETKRQRLLELEDHVAPMEPGGTVIV